MANLLNECVKDPYTFFKRTPILQDKFNFPPPSGIVEFDLKKAGPCVSVSFKNRRSKSESKKLAYWLRWEPSKTRQIILSNDAAFFFTSPLSGCQLRILPGLEPLVFHIAGNIASENDPYGSAWRLSQAQKALGDNMGRSRPLSSTQQGKCGYGYYVLEDGLDYEVNVIGFKKISQKTAQWEFWAQQVNLNTKLMTRFWRFL